MLKSILANRRNQLIAGLMILIIIVLVVFLRRPADQPLPESLVSKGADVPTWTPRAKDIGSTPTVTGTATEQKSVSSTPTPPTQLEQTYQVSITVSGGNLSVRRGPSVDYNPIGFLADGAIAEVIGRDRVKRWVQIIYNGKKGWVSTLTSYSEVEGPLDSLPVVYVAPASPAVIRNCTKHILWIMPSQVQLLTKFEQPYNEARFGTGLYQVYDLDGIDGVIIQEVNLLEAQTVEILRDGLGEKSKCY